MDERQTRYVAHVTHIPPGGRRAYAAELGSRAVPVWRELAAAGLLAEQRIYELMMVYREHPAAQPPHWSHLRLARLAPGADPDELLRAERARLGELPGAVLRAETLRGTPRSLYLPPSAPDPREEEVVYSVEYIDVSAGGRDEYRESMRANSGPAIGRLIAAGDAYSFEALETDEVLFSAEGLPPWNQIHVLGLLGSRTMEAFSAAFDRALLAVNPAGGYRAVFGRLDEYRTIPRWDYTRELVQLRVGSQPQGAAEGTD